MHYPTHYIALQSCSFVGPPRPVSTTEGLTSPFAGRPPTSRSAVNSSTVLRACSPCIGWATSWFSGLFTDLAVRSVLRVHWIQATA
jgi:hypothetical protein